ncbi:ArsR/SmtB family transcription factor [Rhodococcoides corynebacterioides]|uniref:Winged helix-turn-helix transcriptional regulator n=1 Tax=Rhodococcoides corynebacterioides TaxID=53972 RepID=A0ABS7P254_9NOCA|nr:helix-turn-helix domain-containing protein [Rhodococcus corynebacterioides]MBY6365271.1 winged helix-turn-helix transcriptional regulator [Rhodococcus corynebacterioides]MBY6406683.1 winged helix-turn-helix transcriptional regulator [Rhodococcus corynebacterioides]
MSELADRLAALEARVAALESAGATAESDPPPSTGGAVGYSGDVHLAGDVSWSISYSPDGVLGLPPERSVEVLAALGHPVRFAIVRALLRGPMSATALQDTVDASSAGRLYHHLKALTGARIVDQHARGDYRLAPSTVVPALVLMLASADIAGEVR